MSTRNSFYHIKIHKSFRPIEVGSRNNKYLEVLVKFSLQGTTRLILSYDDYDEEEIIDVPDDDLPPLESPFMAHDPYSVSSLERLSLVLHNLSIENDSDRGLILSQLAKHVVAGIKAHNAAPKNVAHQLCLHVSINLVLVHRDQVSGPRVGSTPADDGAIGCLKRFRVEEYVKDHVEEGTENCLVCLEELLSKEEEITCLPCDHAFHDCCIVKWLKTSHFCPLCRFELPVSS